MGRCLPPPRALEQLQVGVVPHHLLEKRIANLGKTGQGVGVGKGEAGRWIWLLENLAAYESAAPPALHGSPYQLLVQKHVTCNHPTFLRPNLPTWSSVGCEGAPLRSKGLGQSGSSAGSWRRRGRGAAGRPPPSGAPRGQSAACPPAGRWRAGKPREGGGQAGRRHVGHGAQVRPRLLAGDALDFLAPRRADDLWKGERERGVGVC